MKFIKSDWTLLREAEEKGLVASMTGIVLPNRTTLSDELSDYFREKITPYYGSFDEEEGEEILYAINEYIEEKGIDKYELDFPFSSGSEIYLIPVGEHIQVKVLVVDEYHGDGDYSKYVDISYFVITEYTTKEDVDALVDFMQSTLGVK